MSTHAAQLQELLGKTVEVHVGKSRKVVCFLRGKLHRGSGSYWHVGPAGLGGIIVFPTAAVKRIEPGPDALSEALGMIGAVARIYV